MTGRQFMGWQHYYELEPFGEQRADDRAASIERMIFNMAVSAEHRKGKLEDFGVHYTTREDQEQTERDDSAEQIQAIKAYCMAIDLAAKALGQGTET